MKSKKMSIGNYRIGKNRTVYLRYRKNAGMVPDLPLNTPWSPIMKNRNSRKSILNRA
jgi:hypothetical protein